MKMNVEFRRRPAGDWFVRVTSGRLGWARIEATRESALRALARGQRWIIRRAA